MASLEDKGEESALPLPRRQAYRRGIAWKEAKEEEEQEEEEEEEDDAYSLSSLSLGDEDVEEEDEEEEEGGGDGGIMSCPLPSFWQLLLPFLKRHLATLPSHPSPFLLLLAVFILVSVLI